MCKGQSTSLSMSEAFAVMGYCFGVFCLREYSCLSEQMLCKFVSLLQKVVGDCQAVCSEIDEKE